MIDSAINVAFWASSFLTLVILLLPSQYNPQKSRGNGSDEDRIRVQILVLGDIGRSPRMQYHALSVARRGGHVDVIGYLESVPHPDLVSNPSISIVPIPSHPAFLQTSNKLLFLVFAPLKVLFQVASLWICLAYRTKPAKWMLIQNPPSIPTLALASLVCFFRQTRLVIDWHNFGYSILALKLGGQHFLVRLSKWYERIFCGTATAHLCVTKAMARVLKEDFGITQAPILPLHDRPANHFRPILDSSERVEFLQSLPEAQIFKSEIESGNVRVLVSSTSWTADEDFSVLIDALCRYSRMAATKNPSLPPILAIITGKGPQKQMYLDEIAARSAAGQLRNVVIKTAWLSTLDYAKLLGCASLGVSLHTSSSGVDLPMKVVDMFGAGLPVVGWNQFEAWPELVTEGVNGRGFGSAQELAAHLAGLFANPDKLQSLKNGALKESLRRWDQEWDPIAGRLFGLIDNSQVKY